MVLPARGHEAVLGEQLQPRPLEEVAVDTLGGARVEDQEPRGRLRGRVQPVIRLRDLGEQIEVASLEIVRVALEAPDRAVHGAEDSQRRTEPSRAGRRGWDPVVAGAGLDEAGAQDVAVGAGLAALDANTGLGGEQGATVRTGGGDPRREQRRLAPAVAERRQGRAEAEPADLVDDEQRSTAGRLPAGVREEADPVRAPRQSRHPLGRPPRQYESRRHDLAEDSAALLADLDNPKSRFRLERSDV